MIISYGLDVVAPYRVPSDTRPVIQAVWVVHDARRSDKVALIGEGSNEYTFTVKNSMAHIYSSREMSPPDIIAGWYTIKYIRKSEVLCKSDLFYFSKDL
jgi:hypothetical protein